MIRLFRRHTGTHVPAAVAAREWPTQLDVAQARRTLKRYAAYTGGSQWPPPLSKEQLALISDHQHDAALVLSAALERAESGR